MPHRPISPRFRKRWRGNSCFSSYPGAAGAALSATNSRTASTIWRCSGSSPKSRCICGSVPARCCRIRGTRCGIVRVFFIVMRLYNSLSRQVEEVKPVDGRTVKIYSCGPTVYRYAHIGNMRTFMLGDLIRRALRFEGLDAFLIMNITHVGHMTDDVSDAGRDKMDLAAEDEDLSPEDIAGKYAD